MISRLSPLRRHPTVVLPALLLMVLSGFLPASASQKKASETTSSPVSSDWENTIVHIEVTSKAYDYRQPWAPSQRDVYKSGIVIDHHQILTTAEGLADQTLVRLKKQGGGLFSLGRVLWIDYHANLAALSTDEKDFWTGLQPAKLASPVPTIGMARILRWDDNHLENRQAEIERVTVDNNVLSFVSVPVLKLDSTISSAGYGEAVVVNNKVIGLVSQQDGDALTAIPTSFIAPILAAREAKTYTGIGYFDFTWDPAVNPLNLSYLKLPSPPRGVIVKETGMKPGSVSVLKPRDVILQIDGFPIDAEGNYPDPEYKKLLLENLSSRGKWAGMTCQMKIWREGKEQDVVYRLPKAEYTDELVPSQTFDQAPEYVLTGGFIFVQLTDDYLRSLGGADWRQRAPFRLTYYNLDKVHTDRPERVVLSQVLPDPVNIGYENLRNLVIDEVNGVKIGKIADIVTALKSPINGFDVFKFAKGEPVRQAVLEASKVEEADQIIMPRFHIPEDHFINSPAPLESSDNLKTTSTTR